MTDKPRDCKNGDVRLQGGANRSNGYVEVCLHRHWLAVCSDETDMDKAEHVCNQLEFNPQGIYIQSYINMYTQRFTLYPCLFLKFIIEGISFKLDAKVIRGPKNKRNNPSLAVQVTCEGSVLYFNECRIHGNPPNGFCINAAISCGKMPSE